MSLKVRFVMDSIPSACAFPRGSLWVTNVEKHVQHRATLPVTNVMRRGVRLKDLHQTVDRDLQAVGGGGRSGDESPVHERAGRPAGLACK